MSADPARAELDRRVLEWIADPCWSRDDARFDALARDLFAFQVEHCAPYRSFCQARGVAPAEVTHWTRIPAVPTGSFKEVDLRSHPPERTVHTFRTSGTTSTRRGALHLDTLALYEASLLASFGRLVLPDLLPGERLAVRVLAPSPEEAPDSSLSHMFGAVVERFGDARSGFDVQGGRLCEDAARAALYELAADAESGRVLVCGTAWAFVHLLDALERTGERVALPPGARLLETGGYKGRSRELARDELYTALSDRLGVPTERILNQYGMTELGSQLYDSPLRLPGSPRRKLAPPWTRVRVLDPATGEEAPEGEPGVLAIVDLANTGSLIALETADLGRQVADGFEVLGRQEGAEERGCSIAADAMLGGAA